MSLYQTTRSRPGIVEARKGCQAATVLRNTRGAEESLEQLAHRIFLSPSDHNCTFTFLVHQRQDCYTDTFNLEAVHYTRFSKIQ